MSVVSLPPSVQACLERLASHRGRQPGQVAHFQRVEADVRQQLQDVGLVHGVVKLESLLKILGDGELKSKQRLADEPPAVLPALVGSQLDSVSQAGSSSKEQQVFTSVGILYPSRKCCLVFRATAETEKGRCVLATPFDLGNFIKGLTCAGLKDETERQRLFDAYCLPAPGYRDYMIALVASCFEHSAAWLTQKNPCFTAPDGLLGDVSSQPQSPKQEEQSRRNRVFEVRFKDALPLDMHLEAVFVPEVEDDFSEPSMKLKRALARLEANGTKVYYYHGRSIQEAFRQWLGERLEILL